MAGSGQVCRAGMAAFAIAAVAVVAPLAARAQSGRMIVVGDAGGQARLCALDPVRGSHEALFDLAAPGGDHGRVEWAQGGAADVAFGLSIAQARGARVVLDFTVSGTLVPKRDPAGAGFTLDDAAHGLPVLALRDFSVRDAAGRDVAATWDTVRGDGPAGRPVLLRLAWPAEEYAAPFTVAGRLTWSDPQEPAAPRESAAPEVDAPPGTDAPPPNDTCAGAFVIPAGPYPVFGALTPDITSATQAGDPPAPTCQPNVSRGVWYRFTPAVTGTYAISTCADEGTATTVDDTVLAVYASSNGTCAGTFTEVAGGCDDDSCASEVNQSVIEGVTLTAGVNYAIVISKYSTSAPSAGNTAVQPRVQFFEPPGNDACAGSPALALDRPVRATTAYANDDYRLPEFSPCFTGIGQTASTAPGRDVAYRFTPPSDGTYSIRVTGASTAQNPVLYLAADCPAGAPPRLPSCLSASNRNTVNGAEEINCVALTGGVPYFVYVDESSFTAGGAVTLEATRCTLESEPNGDPPSADDPVCGIEGAVSPAGDADFFRLGTPAAGSRIFALADGVAANSTDLDLRVTTTADTLEYDDANNDTPFGSLAPNTSGAIAPGGPVYLRVDDFDPAGVVEPYRLYYVVQPPSASAIPEVEPNDTVPTATFSTRQYYSGTIASGTDTDLFAFDAYAGQLLFVALDADPGRDGTPFNPKLELLDQGGAVLALVDDGAATSSTAPGTGTLAATTPESPGEALTWRVRAAGRHVVRVGSSGGTTGDYLLSVATDCAIAPPDSDGDGVVDPADCAPGDPSLWAPPGPVANLRFPKPSDKTALAWSPPAAPGGTGTRFDLLRSTNPRDFGAPFCVVRDTPAITATDPAVPARLFAYLVRAKNGCGANAGTTSAGVPRSPGACP